MVSNLVNPLQIHRCGAGAQSMDSVVVTESRQVSGGSGRPRCGGRSPKTRQIGGRVTVGWAARMARTVRGEGAEGKCEPTTTARAHDRGRVTTQRSSASQGGPHTTSSACVDRRRTRRQLGGPGSSISAVAKPNRTKKQSTSR